MERAEENEGDARGSRKSLSPSKDDSLTDFKSPKIEPAAPIRARVIIDKKPKKSSSKGKTASKKKKETVAKEVAQPSIESSFFKAAVNGKRDGHTCPLCMKYFADVSTGTSHTKSCAAKNKVSTKKLLAAVALQERQANERVAIGLPAGPIVLPKDKTPRRPREAGAKGDPDLQLALALSKSLQENQLEQEFEEAILLAAEHRGDGQIVGFSSDNEKRKTLTNFGFLTNKPAGVSDGPGRTRRRKHLGPTILQTRSQEARDRLLTDRVAEILMGNEAITQVCRQDAIAEVESVKERRITLRSHLLREIHRTTKRVWDIARMSTKITDFYVEDLAPVIAPAESQKQENSENLAEERNNDAENAENRMDVSPVLPEESPLEEDDKQTLKMSVSSEEQEKVNESAQDRLKIPSPNNIHITDRQYRNTLPMDWTNTLNVSSVSDVIVLVEKGHIWAHKLVFHVRCSDILLDCETNTDTKFPHVKEKISWPDVDLSTGLAFLEFVYSGLIEKNIKVFTDNNVLIGVRRLARKYKVKALFDYLRIKQADFEKVNNVSEELKSHKFGLCSPVAIETHKAPRSVETIEENLSGKAEGTDAEEVEGRKSGLCSPIVIEVEGTPSDVESTKENLPANGEIKDAKEDRESPQNSPSRNNDQISITETNIPMQKNAESNSQSQNTDAMSVISISSSRSRVSMSPDLFDETTEEASVDTAKNSEEVDENPDLPDDENSNLKVLADLMAQNDFSSSSEASRQSAASVITQDKIAEKSLSVDETSKFSTPTQHVETPKSRSNSAGDLGPKIKDRSRSQLFPEKQKSNLSLFIAKIQKINAKGPLDFYTDEESMAELQAPIRRRNPFNVNDITDKSILDSNEKKPRKLGRREGKRGLSVFDEPIQPINPKKVNLGERKTADDTVDANETAQEEKSYLVDDTFNTDEEDTSMYSKYRKTHVHNNSISNYRNRLKQLAMPSEDDDKSDNPMSPDEKPIDLTQESDSEVDMPPNRISEASPSNKQKIADDTSDSDSIHSAATALAHHGNLHELSDEDDSKDAETEKASSIASSDKRTDNDDKTKGKNSSRKSDLESEGSSDSDDALTESPLGEKTTKKEKTKVVRSSEDLKKKERNVPTYSIEISPESVKSSQNSSRHSNHDLLEGDDEIFAGSWKSKTPSPSTSSAAPREDILSSGRKKNIKKDKKKYLNSVDGSHKNEKKVPQYSIDTSPESVKSSRNSPQYSNHDLLEGDTEIFARSWKSKTPSPSKSSAAPLGEISSSGRKEKTNKGKTKGESFINDSNKNKRNVSIYSIDISPENVKSSRNALQYSNHDLLEGDTEIFARSWKSKTPSPSKSSAASPGEILSSGRKEKTKKGKTKGESFVDDSNKNKRNVSKYSIDISPENVKSSKTSPQYSNRDLLEGDTEIFARSWKSKTPSPSKSSAASQGEILSSRRKENTKKSKTKSVSSSDDLNKNDQDVPKYSIDISPESVKSFRNSPRYSNHDLLEDDDEIFARSWKSRSPSPLPNSSAPAARSFSSGRKEKSEEIRPKSGSFNKNLDDEETAQLRAKNKSSTGEKSPRNSPEYSDLDVFEIDEEIFAQSLKKTRALQQSPPPSQKRSLDYLDNSETSRRKRRAEEKKAKETNIVKDLGTKNVTNSSDYPDIDANDLIAQTEREAIERFRRRRKERSKEERRKTPEICIDSCRKNKSNTSSEAAKSFRNSSDFHYEDFEPDDHVFTQSFNSPPKSPCRTLSPLPNCASTSKNNYHCSTLKVPSPILITSSPEFDIDAEIKFSNHGTNPIVSNKENLFGNDRRSPLSSRKSYDNLADVISPTNFECSLRFRGEDFEKPVEKKSTSNLERPTSPQPSTSSKFSSKRRESASSSKNPLVRWNSMPASSSKPQVGSKRSRTPTNSSRLIMSQDVTPPVNYDMMDTPELKKELSKYGIKPQSRTRARKLLTHIYNELHPLVPSSPDGNKSSNHLALSDDDEPPTKKIGKPSKRTSEDSDSDRELPLSQESVKSAANVIPEEMDFADGNISSDDCEETSTSSIEKAFKALLKADKEIHTKVLIYEPLPFELLHLMLKTRGLKCKSKDLMDFLDEECITFQVENQRNNNRGRGKKTARGRKGIPSTQKS